jgi:hypothetical protein
LFPWIPSETPYDISLRQSGCLDRNLSIVIFNIIKFIRWHFHISHFCMTDGHLSFVDLTNLKDLQLSCCKITDLGVSYIRGKQYQKFIYLFGGWSVLLWMYCCLLCALFSLLFPLGLQYQKVWQVCLLFPLGLQKLTHLNLEGCPVTAACLEAISGISSFPDSVLCCAFKSWYYVTSVKVSYLFLLFSWFISI